MANKSAKLREWFDGLEPSKRQNLMKFGAIGAVFVLALGLYYASDQDKKVAPVAKPAVAVIEVGEGRLEDDMRATLEK